MLVDLAKAVLLFYGPATLVASLLFFSWSGERLRTRARAPLAGLVALLVAGTGCVATIYAVFVGLLLYAPPR